MDAYWYAFDVFDRVEVNEYLVLIPYFIIIIPNLYSASGRLGTEAVTYLPVVAAFSLFKSIIVCVCKDSQKFASVHFLTIEFEWEWI